MFDGSSASRWRLDGELVEGGKPAAWGRLGAAPVPGHVLLPAEQVGLSVQQRGGEVLNRARL